ncbi:hypothetical protein ES703_118425 [subsurface metagenome]
MTGDTPLILHKNGLITIKTIDSLTSSWSEINGKEYGRSDFEVWSDKGFTKINRIIRHKTNKNIYRVLTHTSVIDVTEDHSLLKMDGAIIKPSNTQIGTELLHSFPTNFPEYKSNNLSKDEAFIWGLFYADGSCGKYDSRWSYKYSWAINNQNKILLRKAINILDSVERNNDLEFKILDTIESSSVYKLVPKGSIKFMVEKYRPLFYDRFRFKKVPDLILNAPMEIKQAFFEGYYAGDGDRKGKKQFGNTRISNKGKIGSLGLFYILKSLGYKVSINIRKDKMLIYRLTATKSYQRKNTNSIKKIINIGPIDAYVYDLETENNHFHGGVGQMIVHNTDSVFLSNPTKTQMQKLSEWSKEELDLDLEEEKTYQFLALSQRKKNYVGIYKDTKYVDIKGLVAKKKNTPEFIKKVFNKLIEILKTITNDDEFSKAKSKIIDIVKDNLKKIGKPNTFSLEDYAINIAIQKNLKDYIKVVPQHVRAARELKKATGKEYQKGETSKSISAHRL